MCKLKRRMTRELRSTREAAVFFFFVERQKKGSPTDIKYRLLILTLECAEGL